MSIPHAVLKQDHHYDCTKCISSYVVEGSQRDPQPYNQWASMFIKQHKRNIRRLHAYWGMSRPKLAYTHRRYRNAKTKKKRKTPGTERFSLKIPRGIREALLIDKNDNNNLWAEAIAKERTALIQKGVLKFNPPSTTIPK